MSAARPLSEPQLIVLRILEGCSKMGGRDIATAYLAWTNKPIPWGTLYTLLRRLDESGLVVMEHGRTTDQRRRLYRVTDAGQTALRDAVIHYEHLVESLRYPCRELPRCS